MATGKIEKLIGEVIPEVFTLTPKVTNVKYLDGVRYKIGRLVCCSFRFEVTSGTISAGTAILSGLTPSVYAGLGYNGPFCGIGWNNANANTFNFAITNTNEISTSSALNQNQYRVSITYFTTD